MDYLRQAVILKETGSDYICSLLNTRKLTGMNLWTAKMIGKLKSAGLKKKQSKFRDANKMCSSSGDVTLVTLTRACPLTAAHPK
jgi:hypothetical protein